MSNAPHLIDLAVQQTKEFYAADPTGQAPPRIFGVKDGEVALQFNMDFENDFAKSLSIMAAGAILHTEKCDASIFTSEVWMSVVEKDDAKDIDLDSLPRPSQDPKREEALLVEVSSPDHYIVAMFKMVRDADGKLTSLDEFQRHDSHSPDDKIVFKSRFDFFKGLETTKVEEAMAERQRSTVN